MMGAKFCRPAGFFAECLRRLQPGVRRPAELAVVLSTAIRNSVSPPFRPPRYILSHEHVPYCDLTIEIAQVGWAGEFRQFVVLGRLFPISIRFA
jgi:hypothetical protein